MKPRALSLHERIRSEIEGQILSGALKPGEKIPSELELMAHYGCARMTVNKALSALNTAGLLERRKRAGSFVARPRGVSMVLDVPDLGQEIASRGQTYAYRLIAQKVMARAADPHAAAQMGDVGPVLAIEGVHYADGAPMAHEERYVNLAVVPEIAAQDFTHEAPGSWLIRHIPWTEAENRISAAAAARAAAEALGVRTGAPCLAIERRTWRGADSVTFVRQMFLAGTYELVARFGPARG